MTTARYPWYEVVDQTAPVLQGDFLLSCPVFIPSVAFGAVTQNEEVSFSVREYDVIVMTQSCDLELQKVDLVLVCPIWPLTELENKDDFLKSTKGKEALRQGNIPGYHLLNKCEAIGFNREYMVVDFRASYSLPFVLLTEIANRHKQRLRLLPPYREHLSQAYARFFMRVGLPVDIPPFKSKSGT